MSPTRRNLSMAMVGAGAAAVVASCTQQQIDDTAAKVAAVITAIQTGVKAGCATAGVVIPTANSILSVIGAMFAGVHPAILTGVQIAQVVSAIVEQACAGTSSRRSSVTVKGVPVEFY